MKKLALNSTGKRKLELKKTAISNLQMSDEQMRLFVGGKTNKVDSEGMGDTHCTSGTETIETFQKDLTL